jgi:hypothetical protein
MDKVTEAEEFKGAFKPSNKPPSEKASVCTSAAGRYTLPEQGTATVKLLGEVEVLVPAERVKMMGSDSVEVEDGGEGCATRRLGVVTVSAAT